jgi:CheY-like chemotaxis protein
VRKSILASIPTAGTTSVAIAVAPTSVLVVADPDAAIRPVVGCLGARPGVTTLVARSQTRALLVATEAQPEVALIDLVFGQGAGIALACEVQRAAPHVAVVFFVEHPGAPEAHAARDLGITRVVATAGLADWLAESLAPLADAARAQRTLDAARVALGGQPASTGAPSIDLPLPVAERRYREAYLRACMSRAGGRREAARLAGVPYSSLCVMLRKLGIGED